MKDQVQGFIDAGLLVQGADGLPLVNADRVLESERQSMMTEFRQQEEEMIVPNRRQAKMFE